MISVAAAQLGPASALRAETARRIASLIDQAGAAGVSLVVFPELALSTYFAAEIRDDVRALSELAFPSDETRCITEAAARGGVCVVLPFAEVAGSQIFNSAAWIDAGGQVQGMFRKVHIPGYVDVDPTMDFQLFEKRYFAPGDLGFPLFDSPAGLAGIGICYDRRFPETYRSIMLGGGSVACIGYNSPVVSGMTTLEQAREEQDLAVRGGAISNGITVVAAGKAGVENGQLYSGDSCVVDHRGRVIARAVTDGDELVVGHIDVADAEEYRKRWRIRSHLRPDAYVPVEPVDPGPSGP